MRARMAGSEIERRRARSRSFFVLLFVMATIAGQRMRSFMSLNESGIGVSTLPAQVELYAELLDGLGIRQTAIMAISGGGQARFTFHCATATVVGGLVTLKYWI
jgi:hypothetical protein